MVYIENGGNEGFASRDARGKVIPKTITCCKNRRDSQDNKSFKKKGNIYSHDNTHEVKYIIIYNNVLKERKGEICMIMRMSKEKNDTIDLGNT